MRDRYADFMARPERIEEILRAGAQKARRLSAPFIERLREAVGLRRSVAASAPAEAGGAKAKGKAARFVSFRDEAGQFRFRLIDADGSELLSSEAFDDPKAAGAAIKALQAPGAFSSLAVESDGKIRLVVDSRLVCSVAPEVAPRVDAALQSMGA